MRVCVRASSELSWSVREVGGGWSGVEWSGVEWSGMEWRGVGGGGVVVAEGRRGNLFFKEKIINRKRARAARLEFFKKYFFPE